MHNQNKHDPVSVRHILLLPRGTRDGLYGVYAMDCSGYFQGEGGPATGTPSTVIIDPQITYSFLQGLMARITEIESLPERKRTLVLMLKEIKDITPFKFEEVKNLFAVDVQFWEGLLGSLKAIKRTGKPSRVLVVAGMNVDNELLSDDFSTA